MNGEAYEILAYAARYYFTVLALIIVWRAVMAFFRDRRERDGSAGCVGELILIGDGSRRRYKKEQRYPLPAEAVLGSGMSADIRVSGEGIAKKHLFLTYSRGEVLVHPLNGAACQAPKNGNGEMALRNGSRMTVGPLQFRAVIYRPRASAAAARGKREKDAFRNVWETPSDDAGQ